MSSHRDGKGESRDDVDGLLDRLRAGDASARDELIDRSVARMSQLARGRLRDFPQVARWEETNDVLQGAAMRLHRALSEVHPANAKEFFGLASLMIRRELIDLKRRLFGPEGFAANHISPGNFTSHSRHASIAHELPADSTLDPSKLARWTELHDRVAQLPDELREVFDLIWYSELSHDQAAAALGTSTKTVQRRWREARLQLHHLLEDGV